MQNHNEIQIEENINYFLLNKWEAYKTVDDSRAKTHFAKVCAKRL